MTIKQELILSEVLKLRQRHRSMGIRKLYEIRQPFMQDHQIKMGRDAFSSEKKTYLYIMFYNDIKKLSSLQFKRLTGVKWEVFEQMLKVLDETRGIKMKKNKNSGVKKNFKSGRNFRFGNLMTYRKLRTIGLIALIAITVVACHKDDDCGKCAAGTHCEDGKCVPDRPAEPSICAGCGMEHGHCKPGCTHGTNCICHDTIPGTNTFNTTITITNQDQLRAICATDTVFSDLNNPNCLSVSINASGLVTIVLNGFEWNTTTTDLQRLVGWSNISDPKLSVQMPQNGTIKASGPQQPIADKNNFMSIINPLANYWKLAPKTLSSYFSTEEMPDSDTIGWYAFEPRTINLGSGAIRDLDLVDEKTMNGLPGSTNLIFPENNNPQNGIKYNVSRSTMDNIALPVSTFNVGGYPLCDGSEFSQPTGRKFVVMNNVHPRIGVFITNALHYGNELGSLRKGLGISTAWGQVQASTSIQFETGGQPLVINEPTQWPQSAMQNGEKVLSWTTIEISRYGVCLADMNFVINITGNVVLYVPSAYYDIYGDDPATYEVLMQNMNLQKSFNITRITQTLNPGVKAF